MDRAAAGASVARAPLGEQQDRDARGKGAPFADDRNGHWRSSHLQAVKRKRHTGDATPEKNQGSHDIEQKLFTDAHKLASELANVEAQIRAQHKAIECDTSLVSNGASSARPSPLVEMGKLRTSKRQLQSELKALRTRIQASVHTGSSASCADHLVYLNFALAVTSTTPTINDLDDDLLTRVFREVLTKSGSSPASMISLGQVCKRWRKLIRCADVWDSLHFKGKASSVTDEELLALTGADGAMSNLTSISLASCTQISEASLLPLLELTGKNLKRLDLTGCCQLKREMAEHVVRLCPNLEHLNMSRCSGVMLDDLLDKLRKTELAKTLKQLGIAYMGGVCKRVTVQSFMRIVRELFDFMKDHPQISVGSTHTFFRHCMNELSMLPATAPSLCQSLQCSQIDPDDPTARVQFLPGCGHLLCMCCENQARGNLRRVGARARPTADPLRGQVGLSVHESLNEGLDGDWTYVYPCPLCGIDMGPPHPCSRSFSILL